MKQDAIEILFNDESLVRILRHLLVNNKEALTVKKLSADLKLQARVISKIMTRLAKAELVKKSKRKAGMTYRLNLDSELVKPLRELLQFNIADAKKDLKKSFKSAGKVKALILSGVLTDTERSQVDVLIVGDKLKVAEVRKHLRQLGYKTGHDLRYMQLTAEEYNYRKEMNDRILRNMIDFDHEVII